MKDLARIMLALWRPFDWTLTLAYEVHDGTEWWVRTTTTLMEWAYPEDK